MEICWHSAASQIPLTPFTFHEMFTRVRRPFKGVRPIRPRFSLIYFLARPRGFLFQRQGDEVWGIETGRTSPCL
ncbi:hypothetical protein KQX54_017939 [Cotesia glomerata]|uniref:Uncharacterized protein n=1 Tax=Cotesia glomerata TaxID=32391 RepID=A0AAV7J073_COTGL|nr:hypothetical protein KQX54_017939 [Cotesia glomerata]